VLGDKKLLVFPLKYPYYLGSFNANYIIFRNVEILIFYFILFFPQITINVKENIESSKTFICQNENSKIN